MSFRPILGVPRLTQDWGTEQHERETHWTSLFYDLMVVAALNAIAEPFEESEEERRLEEEGEGEFVLTPIKHLWLDALLQFVSVVNPWNALNEYTSMFEDESFVGHLTFFVHAFGVAATTAGCVGELSENYRVLATGIILAKLGLLVLYARPLFCVERARVHMIVRGSSHVVNIILIVWGMQFQYHTFRIFLILATLWDWAALLLMALVLTKEQRIPIHIESYVDRIKEVTMVIFGEAIFAIILQPYSKAKSDTHFYLALAATLWMIYAMAMQEFHILPSVDDHALRRSLVFGFSWYYTQFFKQVCLLGTSIGLKRAHLLMFEAPLEPIDTDTRRLIVWGLSMVMLSVVLIRSYSFGYGRHPGPDDTPELYKLKAFWWTLMAVGVLLPQFVDYTVLEYFSPKPLIVLIAFGGLMGLVIMLEAAMSNIVAAHVREQLQDQQPGELTYLHSQLSSYSQDDTDNHHHQAPAEAEHKKCAFPTAHCPKKERGHS